LVCPDGYHWHLSGHKVLHDRPGLDLWSEATTLYTEVRREGPEGPLVAHGTLRIDVPDLVRLLETLRPMPRDVPGAATAVTEFASMFAGQLTRMLLGR
jgi:cholesterol oxidase